MTRTHSYWVAYRMRGGDVEGVMVIAGSKADAYDKAVYEIIPSAEGELPYSAWVESVTYQNGNYKRFNTCEGLAY